MAFRCQAPASGCHSAWSPPERLPLGLIPCHGSPVTPATLPGRHSAAPAPRTFPKQPGCLPVITGCPNINVTLTQWPQSLPSPLVNLMDLLTSVPPHGEPLLTSQQANSWRARVSRLPWDQWERRERCASRSHHGAVQGEPCPRQRAPDCLCSSSACHRPVPSTTSPRQFPQLSLLRQRFQSCTARFVVGRRCCSSPSAASIGSAGHLLPKKSAPLPA